VLSPSATAIGVAFGVAIWVLAVVGLARSWREDPAARIVAITAIVLAPAAVVAGRPYWELAFAVPAACFIPRVWASPASMEASLTSTGVVTPAPRSAVIDLRSSSDAGGDVIDLRTSDGIPEEQRHEKARSS